MKLDWIEVRENENVNPISSKVNVSIAFFAATLLVWHKSLNQWHQQVSFYSYEMPGVMLQHAKVWFAHPDIRINMYVECSAKYLITFLRRWSMLGRGGGGGEGTKWDKQIDIQLNSTLNLWIPQRRQRSSAETDDYKITIAWTLKKWTPRQEEKHHIQRLYPINESILGHFSIAI